MAEAKEYQLAKIENLILNPSIPTIYANGFTVGYSAGDSHIVFQLHGIPVGSVNFSMITLKSLNKHIAKMISKYEGLTNEPIKDLEEVAALVSPQKESVE